MDTSPPYATGTQRLRLLYRFAMAGDEARVLVMGSKVDAGMIFDLHRRGLGVEVLQPGQSGDAIGFDLVALPGCLTGSLAGDHRSAAALLPDALLRRAYEALRPGGVVVGHLDHLLSLHALRRTLKGELPWTTWSRCHQVTSGPRCLRSLDRAGFVGRECFYVEPQLFAAKALVPMDAAASRGHFVRTIRRTRGQYSNGGFWLRMTLAGMHLGRWLQPHLFFWARRPC